MNMKMTNGLLWLIVWNGFMLYPNTGTATYGDMWLVKHIVNDHDCPGIIKIVTKNASGEIVLGGVHVSAIPYRDSTSTASLPQDSKTLQATVDLECALAPKYALNTQRMGWQVFMERYPDLAQALQKYGYLQKFGDPVDKLKHASNPAVRVSLGQWGKLEKYLISGCCNSDYDNYQYSLYAAPWLSKYPTGRILLVHRDAWPLLREKLKDTLEDRCQRLLPKGHNIKDIVKHYQNISSELDSHDAASCSNDDVALGVASRSSGY